MSIFRTGNLSKSRIEAFSDGVFSIIITLMVFELRLPEIKGEVTTPILADALWVVLPKFLSWVLSFTMVVIFWVNHHRLFSQIKRSDNGLIWLNALFLLTISFLPFPTAVLGSYPYQPLSYSLFGVAMALAAFAIYGVRLYAISGYNLLDETVDKVYFQRISRRTLIFGPLPYLIGAVLAWVNVNITILIFTLIPLYFILPRTRHQTETT